MKKLYRDTNKATQMKWTLSTYANGVIRQKQKLAPRQV